MSDIKSLHSLADTIMQEIDNCNIKLLHDGGSVTPGDVEYLDKLTHTLKSIKAVIAMEESEGSSSYNSYYGGEGASYRGRGRYAKRDSMGRYSRAGYSRDGYSREGYSREGYSGAEEMDELIEEMRGMMNGMPEEKRKEVQRFVEKMERM